MLLEMLLILGSCMKLRCQDSRIKFVNTVFDHDTVLHRPYNGTLLMQSYGILFFVSFILSFVVILSSGYGFSRRASLDEKAVQSAHSGFVPRVGGLTIYISFLGLIPLLSYGFIPCLVFDLNVDELTWLILCSSCLFNRLS